MTVILNNPTIERLEDLTWGCEEFWNTVREENLEDKFVRAVEEFYPDGIPLGRLNNLIRYDDFLASELFNKGSHIMKYMLIKDYNTGKQLAKCKLNEQCQNSSLSYKVEDTGKYRGKLVVRDYHTNKVLQTMSVPHCSIEFMVGRGEEEY